MRLDGEWKRPPYVATFGFSGRLFVFLALWGVFALGFGGVIVWIALTEPGEALDPGFETAFLLAISAAGAVFFAGGLFVWLTAALTAAVALQVDESGVGLGRPPFAPSRTPRLTRVPWSDIETIVIFRQRVPHAGTLRYVGLRLRPGVTLPPGTPRPGSVMDWFNCLWGDVRGDMASVSRTVLFWELDTTLLRRAVAAFAPQVQVREIAK